MLNFLKALIVSFVLSGVAAAEEKAIDIEILPKAQNIQQILHLRDKMIMSEDPKKLSAEPSALCFQATISEFIPAAIRSVKPIYGCIFSDQITMNAALLRAGLYVHTNLGMANDETLFSSNLMNAVGGHDFSGEQLFDYNNKSTISSESKPEHVTLKQIEQNFDFTVIKPIIKKNHSNFIFFAIINTKKFKENLSHELLHAQYYNIPNMRSILLEQWTQASEHDRTAIKAALKNGGYDVSQEELLLREFYSYFLQYNAMEYLESIKVLEPIAPLAPVYGPKIEDALQKHGIKVLTIK